MTQLDKVIEEKLLKDIENLIDPLVETEIPTEFIEKTQFLKISLNLLPTIAREITTNLRFKTSIHKIKLEYYKRNLALLEILSEKQNLPDNSRLVFKIIRENLSLKNISPDLSIYQLYYTYRHKHIIHNPPEDFLLYEPEEHYKIYKLLSTLNLE